MCMRSIRTYVSIVCVVYIHPEPASKNSAEGFALQCLGFLVIGGLHTSFVVTSQLRVVICCIQSLHLRIALRVLHCSDIH